MATRSASGLVYFIEGAGLVKIGWTTCDVSQRLAVLSTASPTPLRFLGSLPARRTLESSIHMRAERWRIHREWFRPNPVIRTCLIVSEFVGGSLGILFEPESDHFADVREIELAAVRLAP